MQRQEREGTGKAEGNIKLDLRGSGIGGRLRRRRAGGVEHLSPVAVHVQLPRETVCPFLLRLPEEGQGRPEGDGLLLGVAGSAAVQWFQEGEPEPLSLQSCSEKVMAETSLPVLGPHLRSSGGLIAALQGSGYSSSLYPKPVWTGIFAGSRLARYKEAACPQNKNE